MEYRLRTDEVQVEEILRSSDWRKEAVTISLV